MFLPAHIRSTSLTPCFSSRTLGVGLLLLLGLSPRTAFAQPQIFSPGAEVDFGSRSAREKVEHRFVLRNRGDRPLLITRIQTSCGCTALDVERMEIAPGAEQELAVRLDLHGREGRQQQFVTLSTNDPQNRVYTLKLTGEAVPDLRFLPRILNLEWTGIERPEGVVEVESTDGRPFVIREVEAVNGRLITRVEAAADGMRAQISVHPRDTKEDGNFTDTLRIATDRDEAVDRRVLVMWRVSRGVTVTPGQINLILRDDESVENRSLMVRGYPGMPAPLEVTRVEWPGREMDIEIHDTGAQGWRILIRGLRAEEDMHGEKLILHTTAAGFERLEVPVRVVRP